MSQVKDSVSYDRCDIILNHYDTWQLLLLSQLTVNVYFLVNVVTLSGLYLYLLEVQCQCIWLYF